MKFKAKATEKAMVSHFILMKHGIYKELSKHFNVLTNVSNILQQSPKESKEIFEFEI